MSEGIPYKDREYLGKYRGIVREVEDPEQLGRIRAQVPSIMGEELLPWAYPCFPIDFFGVPAIDTVVYIEFEAGNVERPLYSGVWFGKGDDALYKYHSRVIGEEDSAMSGVKGSDSINPGNTGKVDEPENPYQGVYPKVRSIKFPSGLIVEIDESNEDGPRFHVFHPTGTFFEIHPDGKVVQKSLSSYSVVSEDASVHIGGALKVMIEDLLSIAASGDSVVDIDGSLTIRVGGDFRVEADGSFVAVANDFTWDGGGGPYGNVVTTQSICPYTGSPHPEGSSKVGCSN